VAGAKNGALHARRAARAGPLPLGRAGALCFAPLNKAALRAGGMDHPDELHWFAEVLAFDGTCVELNVLENLWTIARHLPRRALRRRGAPHEEKVARWRSSSPRASARRGREAAHRVCGLNPHNGDDGAYGREEIDVIGPAWSSRAPRLSRRRPFPADTVFVRATRKDGGYDGVVTMYHDQGQIAMKLMGFDRGVTVQGGLPMPITTPAHGTAYDIAGKGVANSGAMKNAFELACRMAVSAR
jgi:4-hydroxythreonine-4-phosphate dehydrogenase